MKTFSIKAEERKLTGRKVKKLRMQGILPANIFGRNTKSSSIQVNLKEFMKIFSEAGETGVLEVETGGKKIPVLINNVQFDPVSGYALHADLLHVNLKEKVTATVPVEIAGESKAVKDKIGAVLKLLNEIEVEALPGDLPERIEANVDALSEIDQVLKVKDIKTDPKIVIITDGEKEVVKIVPLVSKEAEKLAEEQAAAATAASAVPATEGQEAQPSEPAAAKEEQK